MNFSFLLFNFIQWYSIKFKRRNQFITTEQFCVIFGIDNKWY